MPLITINYSNYSDTEEISNCSNLGIQPSSTNLTTTLQVSPSVLSTVFCEPGPSTSPTKLFTTLENLSLIDLHEDLYLSNSSNDCEPAPDECILSSSDFSTSETRNNVQINDAMI